MQRRYWQFYKSGASLLLMGFLIWACGSNNTKTQEEEVVKTAEDLEWEKAHSDTLPEMPLQEKVDMMLATIQEYHKQAFASEQEKVNSSQLLIEEVEQSITSYNHRSLDSIKRFLESTKNSLYTEETMANLEGMEVYDEHTASLVEGWKRFRKNNEEFENHARAIAIYEDIIKADQSDQGIRTNYNLMVHDFNQLLETKKSEIEALGENYVGLEPFVFFYGTDPVVD